MRNTFKFWKGLVVVLPLLVAPHRGSQGQTPSLVATAMDATFILEFSGSPGAENDGFVFFINPDRIVIVEPSLSDNPGGVKPTRFDVIKAWRTGMPI
jgi:hypothetical protein